MFALAGVLLLAACKSLIPDQPATDPFGLDGTQVAVQLGPAAASLGPAAVSGMAGGSFSFPDLERRLPVAPSAIENVVRVAEAALLAPTGPERIDLSNVVITMQAWQGAASYAEAAEAERTSLRLDSDARIVLTRGACGASSCAYTADPDASTIGTLRLDGGALSRLLHIATSGEATNSGNVTLSVRAEQDELAGAVLVITLDAEEGIIRF